MTAAHDQAPLLQAEAIVRRIGPRGGVFTLGPLSLRIERASFTVVRGASGAGKTTLLEVLAGLARPDEGRLRLLGRDLAAAPEPQLALLRRAHLAFVPQQLSFLEHLPVWENVTCRLVPRGAPRSERRALAERLLAEVGLEGRAERLPGELSGGELQRAAIARASAAAPELLIADEPTSQVDPRTAERIAELLAELRARGAAILASTHDPCLQARADRTLELVGGRLAADTGPAAEQG